MILKTVVVFDVSSGRRFGVELSSTMASLMMLVAARKLPFYMCAAVKNKGAEAAWVYASRCNGHASDKETIGQ